MPKNYEIADNGAEIYVNRIFELADNYINEQLDGNADKVGEYFRDLIFYIADRIEKPDNADINTLDNIFNAYVRLCTRYKALPTLEAFSFLVKINRCTFSDWAAGAYRKDTAHAETVKRWFNTCKSFMVDTLANSRGTDANRIFTAKAAYGMVETAPAQIDTNVNAEKAISTSEALRLASELRKENGSKYP